jgi:agmatine/peptidylarginine deiminase
VTMKAVTQTHLDALSGLVHRDEVAVILSDAERAALYAAIHDARNALFVDYAKEELRKLDK